MTVDEEMAATMASCGYKPTRCMICYPVDSACKGGETVYKNFAGLLHHLGDKHQMHFVRGQSLVESYKFAKNSPFGATLRL